MIKTHSEQNMSVSLVSTIILKVFIDTEQRLYFSLEGKVVPLALPNLVAPHATTCKCVEVSFGVRV